MGGTRAAEPTRPIDRDAVLARLSRARDALLKAIDRGHVPTWLVEAVSTTFGEVTAHLSRHVLSDETVSEAIVTVSRAETLLEVLRSYRTSPPLGFGEEPES